MRRVSALRDPWGALFPVNEAQRATQFLFDTWHAVTQKSPDKFASKFKEAKLTEQFWWYLDQLRVTDGKLTGEWSYEKARFEYNETTGEKIKRIRQDIEYFSNAGGTRLSLTYEFKKMRANGDSWRTYQGNDGMRRFVDGYYAKQQPVAAMVAMTLDDIKRCISGLRKSLLTDGIRDSLQMLPDVDGRYLRDPSVVFEKVAQFDTEHKRPIDQAPPHGSTTLAHIFLPLPLDTV